MADTTRLLNGLKEYRKALDKHASQLRREHSQLKTTYERLRPVYEGRAAADFHAHWRRTDQVFNDYMSASDRVGRLLEERIAALQRADQVGGL